MKNKLIALFAGLSLALVGSAALAAPSADTLLVAGYDSDAMAVIYGVSDVDQADDTTATLDCSLVGTFVYTVGEKEDGLADVESLALPDGVAEDPEDTTDDTTFEPETVIENPDNPELEAVDYGQEGAEECALTSVDIVPNGNGEINHGTVVSTFAKLLKGGNGCLIRLFAQSDFGKAEYDETDGPTEPLEVMLDSIETACDKGKDRVSGDDESSTQSNGKVNAKGQNKDKGRPEHAGPPAHAKNKKGGDS